MPRFAYPLIAMPLPTVAELRREAKFAGIKGYSKMNKKQLCEALGYNYV
jgi:hypothetical protein